MFYCNMKYVQLSQSELCLYSTKHAFTVEKNSNFSIFHSFISIIVCSCLSLHCTMKAILQSTEVLYIKQVTCIIGKEQVRSSSVAKIVLHNVPHIRDRDNCSTGLSLTRYKLSRDLKDQVQKLVINVDRKEESIQQYAWLHSAYYIYRLLTILNQQLILPYIPADFFSRVIIIIEIAVRRMLVCNSNMI